jgi:predicted small secreted protein
MKSLATPILASACTLLAACNAGGGTSLSDVKDSTSYAIGMNMGTGLKRSQAEVDLATLIQGLTDIVEEREPRLSPQDADVLLRELTAKLETDAAERRVAEGGKNKEEGDTYRAENAARSVDGRGRRQAQGRGSRTRPLPRNADRRLGVRQFIQVGSGRDLHPEPRDPRLDRGAPADAGGKQIPSRYTSGARVWRTGSPPAIPSNATLIFEVELLGIEQ